MAVLLRKTMALTLVVWMAVMVRGEMSEKEGLTQCHNLLGAEGRGGEGPAVVFCRTNEDNGTVMALTEIGTSQFLLAPLVHSPGDFAQVCKAPSSLAPLSLDCQRVEFQLPTMDLPSPPRRPRSANPRTNVEFSTIEVAGGEWVCEKISSTQCKPLYPKANTRQQQPLQFGEESQVGAESEQSLSRDDLEGISAIVNDDNRWQWSQSGREREGIGGRAISRDEVIRQRISSDGRVAEEEGEESPEQYVYNINGITWLCRQYRQLQCYPVFSPYQPGEDGNPPGITTPREDDDGYPDLPTRPPRGRPGRGRIIADRRVDETPVAGNLGRPGWDLQRSTTPRPRQPRPITPRSREPGPGPAHKRTTFCSRSIKFRAKDEVVLKYSTYSGNMRLYIQAVREGGQILVRTRMLEEGEEGLGSEENQPPIIIDAEVTCDTISLIVEGETYNMDYDFGRRGVRDLEVVGNLESTGMVPRLKSNSPRRPSLNSISEEEHGMQRLFPNHRQQGQDQGRGRDGGRHPEDRHQGGGYQDERYSGDADDDDEDEEDVPVTEDNLQIEGSGPLQVSLGEARGKEHRYQISKGDDEEVNVEVVLGPQADQAADDGHALVIDNKDYNYTLVVSGQNFQIVHHDDAGKNLTYKHGVNEQDISGVGVSGSIQGTATSFKETSGTARLLPTNRPLQGVSVYGSLCVGSCSQGQDTFYYCQVSDGTTEPCGPQPSTTHANEPCSNDCRKRNDDYYWCQQGGGRPWAYCSPPLVFQNTLNCPKDSDRRTTPDPTDCSRFLSCEQGRIMLEECRQGLHYIHRNRTCEWPLGDECSDPFGRRLWEEPVEENQVDDGESSTQPGAGSTERLDRLPTPVPVANPRIRPSSPPLRTTSRPTGGQVTSGEITQQAREFTGSLTSHGELCTDTCEKRGYPYFWCHKESSNLGQWWDSDFCSPLPTVTQYGKECSNECEQRGEVYFWCNRKIDGGWGYCSPDTVYKEGKCQQGDGHYALLGDCQRYVSCRNGRPILFKCESTLYFDFILQSCTFKKDARCIGVSDEL